VENLFTACKLVIIKVDLTDLPRFWEGRELIIGPLDIGTRVTKDKTRSRCLFSTGLLTPCSPQTSGNRDFRKEVFSENIFKICEAILQKGANYLLIFQHKNLMNMLECAY
jgi:hypothetical protein